MDRPDISGLGNQGIGGLKEMGLRTWRTDCISLSDAEHGIVRRLELICPAIRSVRLVPLRGRRIQSRISKESRFVVGFRARFALVQEALVVLMGCTRKRFSTHAL